MIDLEQEIIWATSTTGDDFRCVHADTAREMAAEIATLTHRNTALEDALNARLAELLPELRAEIARLRSELDGIYSATAGMDEQYKEVASLTARAEQAERRALSAEDIGTLQAAVENMRSADRTDAIIEARWRIAFKLEAMARRAHEQSAHTKEG